MIKDLPAFNYKDITVNILFEAKTDESLDINTVTGINQDDFKIRYLVHKTDTFVFLGRFEFPDNETLKQYVL